MNLYVFQTFPTLFLQWYIITSMGDTYQHICTESDETFIRNLIFKSEFRKSLCSDANSVSSN